MKMQIQICILLTFNLILNNRILFNYLSTTFQNRAKQRISRHSRESLRQILTYRPNLNNRQFLRYTQDLREMKNLLAFARIKEKMLKITLLGFEVRMSDGFLELRQ